MENERRVKGEFSHLLMNAVHVVETVLIPLNARQLNVCSRVCKFWHSIVCRLKRRRKTKAWKCFQHDEEENTMDDLLSQTKAFIQNLYTEPSIVFMMSSSDLELRENKDNYDHFVKTLLPASCKLVSVGCGGVVGTDSDKNAIYEYENSIAVSLLCLPNYDGVEFITSNDIESNFPSEAKTFCENVISESTMPPRVILTYKVDFSVPRKIGDILIRKFPNSLIAGAYVDSITASEFDTFPILHLTAICGHGIQVAAVIIEQSVTDAEGAEERIKILKQHGLREENSFAFMFACLGRGEGLYGESNVESSLFRRYFPKTPLIGLFGNGEIGFDHVTSVPTVQDEAPSANVSSLYHGYTTIFVLVSVT